MHSIRTVTFLAARWSFRLALGLLLLAMMAWAGLRWVIVPQIDRLRAPLESTASRVLGMPVHVGALEAEAGGLGFALTVHDLRAGEPGGPVAFAAERVRAVFSVTSLLRGELRQLVIDRPVLELERATAAGGGTPSLRGEPGSFAAGWLLTQPEIVIRSGRLHSLDAAALEPALALRDVDLIFRGGLQRRAARLDATPDGSWGQRFTLIAQLRRPLLHYGPGAWRRWNGQAYAFFPHLDGTPLAATAGRWWPQAADWRSGRGALRGWVTLDRGEPTSATLDAALADLALALQPDLEPLAFSTLQSRIDWARSERSWRLATHGLQFVGGNGAHWKRGDFDFGSGRDRGRQDLRHLHATAIDLALLADLAQRLPLPASVLGPLHRLQPAGFLEDLAMRWRGDVSAPRDWRLEGTVSGLSLAAQPHPDDGADKPRPGVPGITGADIRWRADASGGEAALGIYGGAVDFPGVFEEPRIALDEFATTVRWHVSDAGITLDADRIDLANADAAGTFSAHWKTGTGKAGQAPPLPGALDLRGAFSRAEGTSVWRYLPLAVPGQARDYVRQAVRAGKATQVEVRVQGQLRQFPFALPGEKGTFRIGGKVTDAVLEYVPRALQHPGEAPWPALTHLAGTLVFEGQGMQVSGASAQVEDHPGWGFEPIATDIADLANPRVVVDAKGAGKLAAALDIARTSPIAELTQHALSAASASGDAGLRLQLSLPIDALPQSKVKGQVTLQGNDIRMQPDSVLLGQARGTVGFSEAGFAIDDVQVALAGGEAVVSGGTLTAPQPDGALVEIRASGTASAEGLRTMDAWGAIALLATRMHGEAPYDAQLRFSGAQPAVEVRSNLQGMALDLPAPLAKEADDPWPMHYRSLPAGDGSAANVRLQVGDFLALEVQPGGSDQDARAAVALGAPAAKPLELPAQGIDVQAQLQRFDVDAWIALGDEMGAAADAGGARAAVASSTLPKAWSVEVGELRALGRTWNDVRAVGHRSGGTWQSEVTARETSGHVAYTQGEGELPGTVQARLDHLDLPASSGASSVSAATGSDVRQLPAIELDVDRFAVAGQPLGRLQLRADNRASAAGGNAPPDWRLTALTLDAPPARLTASGTWAAAPGQGAAVAGADPRRTALDFSLETRDGGELLRQFGMENVLARGAGRIDGHIGWAGAPIAPNYATMDGQLQIDVGAGQFLKTEPGVARLLGVLSLQAIPRRLSLDFRDMFSSGFAFDFIRGDVTIDDGIATTDDLRMKGASAAVLINGSADLAAETQNLRVLVAPELDAGTAALAAALINPAIGIGTFVAQLALKGPLTRANTREFEIRGSWSDPQVERVTQESRAADAQPEAGD